MHDDPEREKRRRELLGELYGNDVPDQVSGRLLRTSDVARLFQVCERTVSEWARLGRISSVRTPGGHRRYPCEQVKCLLEAAEELREAAPPGAIAASVTDIATRRAAMA